MVPKPENPTENRQQDLSKAICFFLNIISLTWSLHFFALNMKRLWSKKMSLLNCRELEVSFAYKARDDININYSPCILPLIVKYSSIANRVLLIVFPGDYMLLGMAGFSFRHTST